MSNDLSVQIDEKYTSGQTDRVKILGQCHFDVVPGELLVVLGESGCGKSTLLRLILALDSEYSGTIKSGGSVISTRLPSRGIVFQEPRLLPWMSTLQNVEFAMSGEDKGDVRRERALSILKLLGLNGFENNLPRELSGGMAHRVAIARALVNMPDILLLDEPFAALDLHTRFRLQDELLNIIEKTKTTTMLVTHDIDEALYLGDRVLAMTKRPGSVKAVHAIPTPKPRKRADPDVMVLRAMLLDELIAD